MSNMGKILFDSWIKADAIGSGTSGTASYLIKQNPDGTSEKSVLKTVFFTCDPSEKTPAKDKELLESVTQVCENLDMIMMQDSGRYFVKHHEYMVKRSKNGYILYIRLENCRSLKSFLASPYTLTEKEVIDTSIKICKALKKCRQFDYIYPNLKPENILLTAEGNCVLADFGSFSTIEPQKKSPAYLQTRRYIAPECYNNDEINETCDTYALGMIMYMLLNHNTLPFSSRIFYESSVSDIRNSINARIKSSNLPAPAYASKGMARIIAKACSKNRYARYISPAAMLEDLKKLKNHQPLDTSEKYENIYSHSNHSTRNQRSSQSTQSSVPLDKIKNGFEKNRPEQKRNGQRSASQSRQQNAKRPKKPLNQSIKVPNHKASDYVSQQQNQKKDSNPLKSVSAFFVHLLPQNNGDRRRESNLKRLIVILALIVIVFVLLVTSCSMRNKSKETLPVNPGESISQNAEIDREDAETPEQQSEQPSEQAPEQTSEQVSEQAPDRNRPEVQIDNNNRAQMDNSSSQPVEPIDNN